MLKHTFRAVFCIVFLFFSPFFSLHSTNHFVLENGGSSVQNVVQNFAETSIYSTVLQYIASWLFGSSNSNSVDIWSMLPASGHISACRSDSAFAATNNGGSQDDIDKLTRLYNSLSDYEQECAPFYIDYAGDVCVRSSREIIINFCDLSRKYLCDMSWNDAQSSLRSLSQLEDHIRDSLKFREKKINPIEEKFEQEGYIDRAIEKYRTELNQELAETSRQLDRERFTRELLEDSGANELLEKDRVRKRLEAAELDIKNNCRIQQKQFCLSTQIKTRAYSCDMLNRLRWCTGTAVQLNIHEEIVDTLTKMSDIEYCRPTARNIANYTNMAFGAAGIALDFRDQGNISQAYAFSDVCLNLYKYARGTMVGESIALASSRVISFTTSFVRAVLQGSVDVATNMFFGIGEQLVGVFKLLEWEEKISNPELGFQDPKKPDESSLEYRRRALQKVAEDMCSTTEGLLGKANMFTNLMETYPRQAMIKVFATGMEFAILHALTKIGIAQYQASKFIKPAIDSMRIGLLRIPAIVTLLEKVGSITSRSEKPVLTMCSELKEICIFASEKIEEKALKRSTVLNALEAIERNPGHIVKIGSASQSIKKYAFESSEFFKKKTIVGVGMAESWGFDEALKCMGVVESSQSWTFKRLNHVLFGDLSLENIITNFTEGCIHGKALNDF